MVRRAGPCRPPVLWGGWREAEAGGAERGPARGRGAGSAAACGAWAWARAALGGRAGPGRCGEGGRVGGRLGAGGSGGGREPAVFWVAESYLPAEKRRESPVSGEVSVAAGLWGEAPPRAVGHGPAGPPRRRSPAVARAGLPAR